MKNCTPFRGDASSPMPALELSHQGIHVLTHHRDRRTLIAVAKVDGDNRSPEDRVDTRSQHLSEDRWSEPLLVGPGYLPPKIQFPQIGNGACHRLQAQLGRNQEATILHEFGCGRRPHFDTSLDDLLTFPKNQFRAEATLNPNRDDR